MATKIPPLDPVYLGPAAHTSPGSNFPVERCVIHMTVSPCVPGQARATAGYFRNPAAGGSAHYVVDPVETVQSVGDSVIAWHAPPNPRSIGFELCGYPDASRVVAAARWATRPYRRTLNRAARDVAQTCLAYEVPLAFLSAEELRAGRRGITTHANVSEAFHQSSHWDPGWWPRRRFMRLVRQHAQRIERKHAA